MKKTWNKPKLEIVGFTNCSRSDIITTSLLAEVKIDFDSLWGENFNGGFEDE